MEKSHFVFSQKVVGSERKVIAAVIAETLDCQFKYAGTPSYAYEAGGWTIERDSTLRSPEIALSEVEALRPVLEALSNAGFTAEGNASVIFSKEDCTELMLTTLSNLIKSKQTLLKKALGVEEELTVIVTETEVAFSFFNASLSADNALAYIALARLLMEQAKTLKYASPNEKPVENEKYTFRCFLLRLGLIGDEYKQTRKTLLNRLSGNSAFRDGGKKQESGVA